jgi:hypothetical protein
VCETVKPAKKLRVQCCLVFRCSITSYNCSSQVRIWTRNCTTNLKSLLTLLKVHLQTCSIMASKCITEFTQFQPPRVSPYFLNHALVVHLLVHSIWASMHISEFTQSWPPSASPNLLDDRLWVYL